MQSVLSGGAATPARRLALLIGVESYRSKDFPKLPTVSADLERLVQVLEASKYEVAVVPEAEQGKGGISGRIDTFLSRGDADAATMLIYLSGHGVHVGDRDFLVPRDAHSRLFAERHPGEALIDTDVRAYLADCRASTVIVAVDACRESLHGPEKATLRPRFGEGLEGRIDPRLITVFGCLRGQFCHYIEEPLNASLFGAALCEALSPEQDARSVGDVLKLADKVLENLVRAYLPGREQRLKWSFSMTFADDVLQRVVCEGVPDRWTAAACETKLWDRADPAVSPALRSAVALIAEAAWRQSSAAAATVDDPWHDDAFPERCLQRVDFLLAPDCRLPPAEIAILVAAPFVREATVAHGKIDFAAANPADLTEHVGDAPERLALEAVHQMFPRLTTKGKASGEPERQAIAMWLLHRAIERDVAQWDKSIPRDILQSFVHLINLPKREYETIRLLIGIAMHVGLRADDLARDLDSDRPPLAEAVELTATGRAATRQTIHPQSLAILLALAGQLAVDPRRLVEAVPDHVSSPERLSASDAVDAIGEEVVWTISEDRSVLRLDASCPHPAIHLALEQQAQDAGELLDRVERLRRRLHADLTAPLRGLPRRISSEGLGPQDAPDGGKRYETPLLQFRLAHDEIRDLLMGVQLYGDPALAIRELYQNALDACRYHRARAMYLRRTYDGQIIFRQGTTDHGREYIECEDNGVGMGAYELEHVFSRAGRRFVNAPEFLWEQAKWRKERPDIRLWANSRFGIGVFSYFMLAEEIEIVTARVDRRTLAAPVVLRVDISSSGSLFRIRRLAGEEGHPGGTRVRLYLAGSTGLKASDGPTEQPARQSISCLDSLRDFLAYSEFEVTCEVGEVSVTWKPEELRLADGPPALLAAPNVWFLTGTGGLLADGICTAEKRYGYVVNLTGPQQPALSVDRQRLEEWDEAWVAATVASVLSQ